MRTHSRVLRILFAACYLQVVTASALFHNHQHHAGHDEDAVSVGISASDGESEEECSVCQFLAQKPAPAEVVSAVDIPQLVCETIAPERPAVSAAIFSSWRSRAPPSFA